MKFFKKIYKKDVSNVKKMKIKNYLREYLDSLTDSGYNNTYVKARANSKKSKILSRKNYCIYF